MRKYAGFHARYNIHWDRSGFHICENMTMVYVCLGSDFYKFTIEQGG